MSLSERMEEAGVRIDQLIWLPGAIMDGSMSDALKGAVEDLYGDDKNEVVKTIPGLIEIFVSGDDDDDWVADVLGRADGFLAEMARPVPTSFYGSAENYSAGWGYYRTKWVHIEDMDQLATFAEAFSAEVIASEYAKHLTTEVAA